MEGTKGNIENIHHKVEKFPHIIFLSGASGAGKTALVEKISNEFFGSSIRSVISCLYFDKTIKIPSEEEMIRNYGSGAEWQKSMTYHWVKKLVTEYADKQLIIFEGQTNFDFILEAFARVDFTQYTIILVHCDDDVRHKRLSGDRNQPHLINSQMDNWSKYLKQQAEKKQIKIFDTTHLGVNEMLDEFKLLIKPWMLETSRFFRKDYR